MSTNIEHTRAPFQHQRANLEQHGLSPAHALFWEQGTGKTKALIDNAQLLYREGKINTCLVVAPNGVDENWVNDELPEHWPASLKQITMCLVYRPEKRTTKWHQGEMRRALYHDGFLWLTVPYETFITKAGKKFVWEVLRRRRCLYVLDESSEIKSPSAKRTWSIIASGRYATHKRIAEGTPVTLAPFDVYSQVRFLDEEFWKRELEITTAVEFRQYFGVYKKGVNRKGPKDREFEYCVGYKRLDKLREVLAKVSSRVLKAEVFDLPEKLYTKRYFHLNKEQERVYRELKEQCISILESGSIVSTALPIVQLLRLQQVTCGYVPTDDESVEPVELLGKTNPRLELLEHLTSSMTYQGIIWARFRKDLDLICDMLGTPRCVRYDGAVDTEQRERNKRAFLAGDTQWFVSNPAVAGRGHTFTNAHSCIYYNNSFKLRDRLQSEDRPHRPGLEHSVDYIDLLASGTVDTRILANLRTKVDVASQVTGDKLREWI